MYQRFKASFIHQFHRFQHRWREGHWVRKIQALAVLLALLFVAFWISLVLICIALLLIPYAKYKARQGQKTAKQAMYQAASDTPAPNLTPTGRIFEAEYIVVRK